MKKISLLTFLVIMILLYTTATITSIYINKNLRWIVSYSYTDWQQVKETQAKQIYTCSMHPEVIRGKAGKCPKCDMNLFLKQPAKKEVPVEK